MINFPECHIHASQVTSLSEYYTIPSGDLERLIKSELARTAAEEIANKFTTKHQAPNDKNMTIIYTLDIYCFTNKTLAQFIQAIKEDFLRGFPLEKEVTSND